MQTQTRTTDIPVELDDGMGPRLIMWLSDFLAVNADGVFDGEPTMIRAALERNEVYVGGGGAAAQWTLRRANGDSR